ncbi:hypothetical protein pb186bvf_005752 [Paramecium bursaria]
MNMHAGLDEIKQVINDTVMILRSQLPIKLPQGIYMKCYNFLFECRDKVFIKGFFVKWIEDYLRNLFLKSLLERNNEEFIDQFIIEIELLNTIILWISQLFNSFDQSTGANEEYISEIAYLKIDSEILQHKQIKEKFIIATINLSNELRLHQGQREKLKKFLSVFDVFEVQSQHRFLLYFNKETQQIEISKQNKVTKREGHPSPQNLYQKYMSDQVAEASKQFYRELAEKWKKESSPYEYVVKCLNQFQLENDLKSLYFQNYPAIVNGLKLTLITEKANAIINNERGGIIDLLDAKDQGPLSKMYDLYSQVQTDLEILCKSIQMYIKTQIDLIFIEQQVPPQQVQQVQKEQVSKLYTLTDYIFHKVNKSFNNHHLYRKYVELGFLEKVNSLDKFINKFSLYIHSQMLQKEINSALFDVFLQTTRKLLEMFNNKQHFFLYYRNFLKERIFRGEVKSIEFEDLLITDFKAQHYENFPPDIEQLWIDYKRSRDFDIEINQKLLNMELITAQSSQFTVFTRTRTLNEFKNIEYQVPDPLRLIIEVYNEHYAKQYRSKKSLQWELGVGQGEISYKSSKASLRLIVSNIQLVIIYSLLQNGNISRDDIQQRTKLRLNDIEHHLVPTIQLKLIIEEGGKLKLNEAMEKPPNFKGLVLSILPKKSQDQIQEQERLREELEMAIKDRDYKIQSLIVKQMKTKKEMLYSDIQAQVNNNLKGYFQYNPRDVIRQLDELIAGGYIKRHDRENNRFIYTPAN